MTADAPPEVHPTHVWRLDPEARYGIVDVSADGGVALVIRYDEYVLDAWDVLALCWPEATALVPLLLACWGMRKLFQIAREHHPFGTVYCGRCDYLLRGLTSAACPECGATLAKHRRVARRRLGQTLCLAALPLCVPLWFPLHDRMAPRRESAASWWFWPSYTLTSAARWLDARDLLPPWVRSARTRISSLQSIDLHTGEVVQTLAVVDDIWMHANAFAAGDRLVFSGPSEAFAFDRDSHALLARWPLAPLDDDDAYPGSLTLSADGRTLWGMRGHSQFDAWDVNSGDQIAAAPAGEERDGDYLLGVHDDGFVALHDAGALAWMPSEGMVRAVEIAPPLPGSDASRWPLAISEDRSEVLAVVREGNARSWELWDVALQALLAVGPLAADDSPSSGTFLPGDLLLIHRGNYRPPPWDTPIIDRRGSVVAVLKSPVRNGLWQTVASRDGRTLVSTGSDEPAGRHSLHGICANVLVVHGWPSAVD